MYEQLAAHEKMRWSGGMHGEREEAHRIAETIRQQAWQYHTLSLSKQLKRRQAEPVHAANMKMLVCEVCRKSRILEDEPALAIKKEDQPWRPARGS